MYNVNATRDRCSSVFYAIVYLSSHCARRETMTGSETVVLRLYCHNLIWIIPAKGHAWLDSLISFPVTRKGDSVLVMLTRRRLAIAS